MAFSSLRISSVRRARVGSPKLHPPALALLARSAGQRYLEPQSGHSPRLSRGGSDDVDRVRFQQIAGRSVVAVIFLNTAEERELVVGPHVELEATDARQHAVVD